LKRSRHCSILSVLAISGLLWWSAACGSAGAMGGGTPATLTLFAAASLSEVMEEIAAGFKEMVPGLEIDLILAGSQELRTQLVHGAQSDIFLSADVRQMDLAIEAGSVLGEPMIFATNRLTVIFSNHFEPTSAPPPGEQSPSIPPDLAELKGLADPGISLALALPEVPVGAYARDAIRGLEAVMGPEDQGYAARVMANVVTLETNVRGVAMKVALGEVDAGIVYLTDAQAPFVAENTRRIPISLETGQQVVYLAAVMKGSRQPDLTDRFAGFLLSTRGQTIFKQYGFGPLPAINPEDNSAAPAAAHTPGGR